jgi:hypothetical protein
VSEHIACTCPACKMGLWCADGQRGEFTRDSSTCRHCGVVAWRHTTKEPKGASNAVR